MKKEKQKKYWQSLEQENILGWDFSYIENRWNVEELPWSYDDLVHKYLKESMFLLDMGTGGGERLLTFGHPYKRTSVTEGWLPNYERLQKVLKPLGITIVYVDETDRLDFPDDSFDIVLNSHESYDPREVRRVLRSGGLFITQQVGEKNGLILSEKMKMVEQRDHRKWSLNVAGEGLKKANFSLIFGQEFFPYQKFYDMEGLIYYMKRIPWEYPNFSVSVHFDELLRLQNELSLNGEVKNLQHRFILIAKLEK